MFCKVGYALCLPCLFIFFIVEIHTVSAFQVQLEQQLGQSSNICA